MKHYSDHLGKVNAGVNMFAQTCSRLSETGTQSPNPKLGGDQLVDLACERPSKEHELKRTPVNLKLKAQGYTSSLAIRAHTHTNT